MKALVLIVSLFFTFQASAQNAPYTCYNLATEYPKALGADGETSLLFLSGYSLCVRERNEVVDPTDELNSTGEFVIQIRKGMLLTKAYKTTFKTSEGAAGTIYTTYANSAADLTGEDYMNIQFRITNQPVNKGQRAGSVRISSSRFALIKQ